VRTRAEMWTSRVAESVRDGAADAVVVALHMSIPQGRRSKKALSVGINDERTTPTHARLNKLADVSPQCKNRDSEMQRYCCILLCLRKEDDGDGQAAEEGLENRSFELSLKATRRRSVTGRLTARYERSRFLN
jgi:hypothetical protein